MAGSEACLAEHRGESAGRNSLLPVGRPCRVGTFVKMIHNGIEYGDMQLIAEAYWVMKNLIDLTNEEMADVLPVGMKGSCAVI